MSFAEVASHLDLPSSDDSSGNNGDDVIAARGYDELLDAYSLHQFMIRRGRTLTATPEFVSFQRKYAHRWPAIKAVIAQVLL